MGWPPSASFAEYWSYQTTYKVPLTAFEIEKTSKELVKFVLDTTNSMKLYNDKAYPRYILYILFIYIYSY